MKFSITIVIAVFSYISSLAQNDTISYSFFVAGHTYGDVGINNKGFHPPFKQKFGYLQSRPEIAFGVLTGDIVSWNPTAKDWEEVDADIDTLGLPVYFAVGNHDMEDRPLFEDRYGKTYYNFTYNNDLFIVLDPNIDAWNISGAQLQFLKDVMNDKAPTAENIYVFFHQVLWKQADNQFRYIQWNSVVGRGADINFWTEVMPIFRNLSNKVIMFSGDLGASWTHNVTYDKFDNITLIASGMGHEDGENFIVVNVAANKSVQYDLICLSDSNLTCLGQLTDHLVVDELAVPGVNDICKPLVYPNPSTNRITIAHSTKTNTKIQLLNAQGETILEVRPTRKKYKHTIDVSHLSKGIYFMRTPDISCQEPTVIVIE